MRRAMEGYDGTPRMTSAKPDRGMLRPVDMQVSLGGDRNVQHNRSRACRRRP